MSYRVVIYRQFDAEVEALWRGLEAESHGYLFQAYDWNALWYDCIGKTSAKASPCIVVVSAGDKPVLLFPFALCRRMGINCLEFMGGDQADYLSPLVHRSAIHHLPLREIWRQVEAALPRHDVLILTKMPQAFDTLANPFLDLWPTRPSHEAFATTLPDSWEGMEARISAKLRADSRRQFRRLSERGEIRFQIAAGEKEYLQMLEAMFVQKSRRYQETGVRDILSDWNVKEFYRRAHKSFGKGYSAQMSALLCNGQPIATHWGIVHHSRYYWLMPSFAGGEVAVYSPGRILQEKLLQWCIANRMSLFDFTVGAENYKKTWCDKKLDLYEYVSSKSLMGTCFLAQRNMLQAIKRNPRARAAAMMLLRAWRRAGSVWSSARKKLVGE